MCAIAGRALPVEPMGWTAPHGPALIVTPDALIDAAMALAADALRADQSHIKALKRMLEGKPQ